MINIDDLKNIDTFSSDKICAIIVTAKYFGNNIEVIKICMQVLSSRRASGENFNFEDYISKEFEKLPKQKESVGFDNIISKLKNIGNFSL